MEPGFDATVKIYDGENSKTLNKLNPTGEFTGNYVKIKSNNNAMIYFYGKKLGFLQYLIDPKEKGKNAEINFPSAITYMIDFGFEGFNPFKIQHIFKDNGGNIYIENVYDKLKTKLVKNEYLYIYSSGYFIIKYTENLHHKNNEYNFDVIPKNSKEKSLIIYLGDNYYGGTNRKDIVYQVNFCKSPHTINVVQNGYSNSTNIEFNNEKRINEQILDDGLSIKLNFDSKEDFIFSYSIIDETDEKIKNYEAWNNERQILTNFSIEEVSKLENYTNKIRIKFTPNYRQSSARYVIVITPRNKNNNFENLSNPCYLTKLITEKIDNVLIKTIYDIGEYDLVEVDMDISEILDIMGNYFVSILSQEIRFEKKLNFYSPFKFSYEIEEPVQIQIGEKQEFNLNENAYFNLEYIKHSENKEIFFLYYNLEKQNPINIRIQGGNNIDESFTINNIEGYVNFLFDEGGYYKIKFESSEINNNEGVNGSFKIVSSEYPFKIDFSKNINFDEISINENKAHSLKLYTDSLDKNYVKKITINNIDFRQINKIVSIKKDNSEFKALNFNYYEFEKNYNYTIRINFNKLGENIYTLEKFNIKEFSLDNILNFELGSIKFNDIDDKFLIINWTNYTNNIIIKIKNNSAKFYISKINENQTKNLEKQFQDLNFEDLKDIIIKKNDTEFEVLMIELKDKDTEILFEQEEINDDNNDKEDDAFSVIYIIFIAIGGIILIIVIVLLIIKSKRKNEINFNLNEKNENEKLMSDL